MITLPTERPSEPDDDYIPGSPNLDSAGFQQPTEGQTTARNRMNTPRLLRRVGGAVNAVKFDLKYITHAFRV
jgi:hypothetical protein